jgi:ABC-type tungstate transport system substrate-binding protein
VDFDVLEHARTERAADEAAALGIGAEEVAKTLVLDSPGGNVRAVLAASERIDVGKVATVLGVGGKNVHWRARTTSCTTTRTSSSAPCRRSAVPRIGWSSTSCLPGRDSVVLEVGTHEHA